MITLSSTQVASSSPSCCDAVCNKILTRVLAALGGSHSQSPAAASRSSPQPPGDTCLHALQVLVQLLDGVTAAAVRGPSGESDAAGGASGGSAAGGASDGSGVSTAWSGCSLVQTLPSLAEAVADAGSVLDNFMPKSAMNGLGGTTTTGGGGEMFLDPTIHSELKLLFCRFWGSLAGLTVAIQPPQQLREGLSPLPPPLLLRAGQLHDATGQLLRWSLALPLTTPLGEPGSGSGELAQVPVPSDLVASRMDWGRKHPLQHSAATAVVALMMGPAAGLGGCLRVEDIVLDEILMALMTSSPDDRGGQSLDHSSSRAASEGLCGNATDPTAVAAPMDVDDADNGDGQQTGGSGAGAAIHRRQQALSVAALISRQGPPAFAWQLASRWRDAVMEGLQATQQSGAGQKQVCV